MASDTVMSVRTIGSFVYRFSETAAFRSRGNPRCLDFRIDTPNRCTTDCCSRPSSDVHGLNRPRTPQVRSGRMWGGAACFWEAMLASPFQTGLNFVCETHTLLRLRLFEVKTDFKECLGSRPDAGVATRHSPCRLGDCQCDMGTDTPTRRMSFES